MAVETNPEHVVNFALQPIRHRPHRNGCAHRLVFAQVRLQPQPFVLREGIKIRHQIESLLALRPIHRGEIGEIIEFLFVAAVFRDFQPLCRGNQHDCLLAVERRFNDRRAKSRLQSLHQLVIERQGLRCCFLRRWRWLWHRRRGRRTGSSRRSSRSSRFGRRWRASHRSGGGRRSWFCYIRRLSSIPCSCNVRRFRRSSSGRRIRFRRLSSLRRWRRSRLARFRCTTAAFRPCSWRSYRIFLFGIVSHLSFGFRPPESTQQRQAARFRKPTSQSILQSPIRPRSRSNAPRGPHSQSNAPFRNSHTYPTIKIPRNTSIVNNP